MKLRLQFNSIRLRLQQSEVEQLARIGRVEERIVSGSSDDATFHYILEATPAVPSPQVAVTARSILVRVPTRDATRWTSTDEVGIEGMTAEYAATSYYAALPMSASKMPPF